MQYRSQYSDSNNDVKLERRTTETAGQAVAHVWSDDKRDPVFLYSSLVAGLVSGTASSIVCAPLDLVRTRLQVWGDVIGTAKKGEGPSSRWFVFHMFRDIFRNEGIAGCFRGLTATLLTVPTFWGVYCEFSMFERRSVSFDEQ
jgi:Mitochondrial carrier protein